MSHAQMMSVLLQNMDLVQMKSVVLNILVEGSMFSACHEVFDELLKLSQRRSRCLLRTGKCNEAEGFTFANSRAKR